MTIQLTFEIPCTERANLEGFNTIKNSHENNKI